MSNSLDRETFISVSGLELYDPIRQVLLKLSDLSEEPTESRRKATCLYPVMTLGTLYSRACFGAYVNFVTVATKS